jgi:glycosyltransferase involved in cell wall biosynthesis
MSKNLPVIASRTGGVSEVVEDGETGLLVKTASPDDLSEKMIYLLGNPAKRAEMGKKGFERYRKIFRLKDMAGLLGKMYLEYCRKKAVINA